MSESAQRSSDDSTVSATVDDSPKNRSRRRGLVTSIVFSIAAVMVLLFFVRFDAADCGRLLSRIDFPFIAACCVLYFLAYFFRALRIAALVPASVPFHHVVVVVILHNFYATFLPLKVGEMALPIMLKRYDIRYAQTIGVLLWMRVNDLLVASSLLGIVAVSFAAFVPPKLHGLAWIAGTLAVTALCVLIGLRFVSESEFVAFGRLTQGKRSAFLTWIAGRLDDGRMALAVTSRRNRCLAFGYTVCIWLLLTSFGVYFCTRLVPQIPWQTIAVLSLVMPIASQLPINGFAGIGTSHALTVLFFTTAGLTASTALSLGIVSHAVQTSLIAVAGLAGFLIQLRLTLGEVPSDNNTSAESVRQDE